MNRLIVLVLACSLGPISQGAVAGGHDDEHGKGKGHWKHADDDDRERHRSCGDGCFSEDHIRMIRDYYGPQVLPSGLAKKYYRTGQLPPGWEKKVRTFPPQIEQRLPK